MSKRSITYNGLDCLKDAEDPRYMALGKQLQTDVPWTYQSHYGEVTVYFGVVVIFLACLKHIWYRYTDYAYKRNFNKGVEPGYVGSFIAIVSAFSRNIGYKPVTGFLHAFYARQYGQLLARDCIDIVLGLLLLHPTLLV